MELADFNHIYTGKVRELFEPRNKAFSHLVLIVASDRVSAFDHVHSPEIPGKGANLTSMTNWWFDQLEVPNHRSDELEVPAETAGRGMIAKRLEMFPVECVVRGYLTGSGFVEYQKTGRVCGIELPEGLKDGDRLPHPIYTPAYKAPIGEHDENISFEQSVELIGKDAAQQLRDLSMGIFLKASQIAHSKGLLLADTKFEFGKDPKTNVITLGDEVLTPDSSRYWDRALWEQGVFGQSFDKQIVRDWLAANWDKTSTPPQLPKEIVEKTASRYQELAMRLTA